MTDLKLLLGEHCSMVTWPVLEHLSTFGLLVMRGWLLVTDYIKIVLLMQLAAASAVLMKHSSICCLIAMKQRVFGGKF
jgi:hypothetical protein